MLSGAPIAAPDPFWVVQVTQNDCFGSSQQQTGGCESYATDLYEHLDYSVTPPGAATADIEVVRAGFDDDYYYVEFDYVTAWDKDVSTGHQIVIEIDVDPDTESNRGDYYVGVFQKEEFDSASFVDAYDSGGYDFHVDDNDDVGGNNPTASDFGGSSGDGYENDVNQNNDQVWARVNGGNFQVAVRRSVVGDPVKVRLRSWSRQSRVVWMRSPPPCSSSSPCSAARTRRTWPKKKAVERGVGTSGRRSSGRAAAVSKAGSSR